MSINYVNYDSLELGEPEFRSLDGTNNNLDNPLYGSVGTNLRNIAPLDYGDGVSTPAGEERPNARVISNTLGQQNENIVSDRGLTNFIWAFGQFIDHDIALSPEDLENTIEIDVPAGDSWLDPDGTGEVIIPYDGTAFTPGTGTDINNPAQIPNNITAWLDGSNIYGSDLERNGFLRTGYGGLLEVSEGNLLPLGNESLDNANPSHQDPNSLFAAGDIRANENSVLVTVHTLFVREHNRLATELAIAHPDWTDSQIFERARQINIAQYQGIIYNEYLPSLLGTDVLPEYNGYDSTIDPGISRTFTSAAYRLGHTQVSSEILRLNPDGTENEAGNLLLSEVFFRPVEVIQESGIDPILRGISSSLSQNIDLKLIDDIRNLLFTFGSHTSGRDLFAINVERGRFNGLSDYNTIRESFGLTKVASFDDITSDPELQIDLLELYGNVDNIDPFVGLLAEDHLAGSAVGETVQAIVLEQFLALRDGDRFYYENIFTDEGIARIEDTTLADIILRNTDTEIIQDNVFSLLNEGTEGDDELRGGLGNDSIFGGNGDDSIFGYQGDDFLSGDAGNDLLVSFGGSDRLEGGIGDDNYQLNPTTAGGSEISDAGGWDYLLLDSEDFNLEQISFSHGVNFFDSEQISLSLSTEELMGLEKVNNDLIIDLNLDGEVEPTADLTIVNFFDANGGLGEGAIERINNLSAWQIAAYFDFDLDFDLDFDFDFDHGFGADCWGNSCSISEYLRDIISFDTSFDLDFEGAIFSTEFI